MNDLTGKLTFPKYGASVDGKQVCFRFVSVNEDCGIVLYDRQNGEEVKRLPFEKKERIGVVYTKTVDDFDCSKYAYSFYCGEKVIADKYALSLAKKWEFGEKIRESNLQAVIPCEVFDWGKDEYPALAYRDVVCYCLHTRGFTKQENSGVKCPGTFAGIGEKISYLKGIGITAVELQPSYEFIEFKEAEPSSNPLSRVKEQERVNYWGYTEGFYYAPKSNYACGDPVAEFKALVKQIHKNGMELYMQFYFPDAIPAIEILSVLTFWRNEYHVDGFRIMANQALNALISGEPMLAGTKLFFSRYDEEQLPVWSQGEICVSNDDFCFDMRRFLKSDEGMLNSALYHMRHVSGKMGAMHYLSNYNSFTIADLVSYDYKHNEDNGEENRDGNDYNCSWNCGEEGITKSRKILQLRQQQMKNAYALLLLSPSVPMIFMGDEFGNSQQGNNNPYCQDNEIAWLNWSLQKKNSKLLQFWKQLIALRKEHSVLRPSKELMLMDSKSCGYPDLSYHGESAWKLDTEHYVRHFGMMFSEAYAEENPTDGFLYIGANMHWDKHNLALPKLPKGMDWKVLLGTGEEKDIIIHSEDSVFECPARSICILTSVPAENKAPNKRKAAAKNTNE